jgi:hypothetical protein
MEVLTKLWRVEDDGTKVAQTVPSGQDTGEPVIPPFAAASVPSFMSTTKRALDFD